MNKISRRRFLLSGAAGLTGWTVMGNRFPDINLAIPINISLGVVQLGKTNLQVSPLALGTGTVGYNKASNQTRLGMDAFVKLIQHGYEKGVRFFDMADGYGSHPFVGESIKKLPRENITLLSKIWTHEAGSDEIEPVEAILDRFRKEVNTDYLDIVLMHCLMEGNWSESRKHYIDGLSKAKQDGIVKAVGVSCHDWDALVEAVHSPWVDVIMVRINPFGSKMDSTPKNVCEVVKQAVENGKGVIGMKIFGQGDHIKDHEREESIQYAFGEGHVHSITIGIESIEQLDDAIEKVARLQK